MFVMGVEQVKDVLECILGAQFYNQLGKIWVIPILESYRHLFAKDLEKKSYSFLNRHIKQHY